MEKLSVKMQMRESYLQRICFRVWLLTRIAEQTGKQRDRERLEREKKHLAFVCG